MVTARASVIQAAVAIAARTTHLYPMNRAAGFIATVFLTSLMMSRAMCAPLVVPFDFSQHELGLKVAIKGQPLYAILDTGVDPSLVDLADAKTLGLKINQGDAGEAGGFGEGRGMTVFPAEIEGLTISQRKFKPFDALASDLTSLSHEGQPRFDMVLGYSFLSDKIVLIDYVSGTLAILETPDQANAMADKCKARWTIPLTTLESYPVIPNFRFGKAVGPVTLDTGSNSGIGLFGAAMTLEGMRASLFHEGSTVHRGARGASTVENFSLNEPVGFGPFTLPAGQKVFVHRQEGSADKRVANIGNTLLADLKIKVLLDYRSRSMTCLWQLWLSKAHVVRTGRFSTQRRNVSFPTSKAVPNGSCQTGMSAWQSGDLSGNRWRRGPERVAGRGVRDRSLDGYVRNVGFATLGQGQCSTHCCRQPPR